MMNIKQVEKLTGISSQNKSNSLNNTNLISFGRIKPLEITISKGLG